MTAAAAPRVVDPVAAALYFVEQLGFTAFPVWGSAGGKCFCGDPHDGTTKRAQRGPDNIGKHPATDRGFKDATADVGRIRAFLANPGTPNYGLNAPSGVLAVDVDGSVDLARWQDLQASHGPLPLTLTTTTAHGRHYFYRWPDQVGPMPTGKLFGYVVRRHDDGYVIGPGSVHPTGVMYDTLRQPSGMPYDIAELPRGWAEAAISTPKPKLVVVGGPLPEKGHRHDWLRDTARLFAGTVRDPEALKAALMVENAKLPEPKSEAEVETAIGDVLKKFPPDPTEADPETGAQVRVQPGRRIYAEDVELAMPATAPFPDEPGAVAFEGLAGAAVESLTTLTSASRVGMLTTLLAAWGGLFGSRTRYHGDQPSVLFAVLIGETGRARKGTTTSAVWFALVHALTSGFVAIPITANRWDGLASGEALVRILGEAKGNDTDKPVYGLIVEEEFERLLRRMRSSEGYQSTLDTYLRQAFDARMIQHITATRTLRIHPPYGVSILGNVTRETLRQNVSPDMARSGFANRFMWLPIEEREVDIAGSSPWRFTDEISRALIDARAAWAGGQTIELDNDALALLNEYGAHLRDLTGMVGAMGARLHVIAARIALVHAALDRSMTIGRPLVERAIALTEYTRAGLRWSFRNDIGDEDANVLLSAVLGAVPDGLNTRSARAVIGRSSRFMAARDLLLENQLITLHKADTNPTNGRPSVMLRAVDPDLFRRFVSARGSTRSEIRDSSIHSAQTPPSPSTNRTQNVPKPDETPDAPVRLISGSPAPTVTCHFPHDHSTAWQRKADDTWYCAICSPEEAS